MQDSNLVSLFHQLKLQQYLANVLFKKFKLVLAMHFTRVHITGHLYNGTKALAALTFVIYSKKTLCDETQGRKFERHYFGRKLRYFWNQEEPLFHSSISFLC